MYTFSFSVLDNKIMNFLKNKYPSEGFPYICRVCGRRSLDIRVIKNHIESDHIVTQGFPCKICDRVSKTRQALSKHVYRMHKLPEKEKNKKKGGEDEETTEGNGGDNDKIVLPGEPETKPVVDDTPPAAPSSPARPIPLVAATHAPSATAELRQAAAAASASAAQFQQQEQATNYSPGPTAPNTAVPVVSIDEYL